MASTGPIPQPLSIRYRTKLSRTILGDRASRFNRDFAFFGARRLPPRWLLECGGCRRFGFWSLAVAAAVAFWSAAVAAALAFWSAAVAAAFAFWSAAVAAAFEFGLQRLPPLSFFARFAAMQKKPKAAATAALQIQKRRQPPHSKAHRRRICSASAVPSAGRDAGSSSKQLSSTSTSAVGRPRATSRRRHDEPPGRARFRSPSSS